MIDDDGYVHKQIPLSEEALQVLEETKVAYQYIFERAPHSDDPIFLGKYLYSDEDIKREAVEALRKAEMPPQFIHAYQRTGGLLLSESNEGFATTVDLEEWNAAIEEYFFLKKNPPAKNQFDLIWADFKKELESCIMCLGYVLENGVHDVGLKTASSSHLFTVDDYVLLCATKSIKTLRAVRLLLKEQIGADCLPLARHIYENYLHIVYSVERPEMLEHLLDAVIGLKLGTHGYARNNKGDIDTRKIIRNADGAMFVGHISHYKMAVASRYAVDLELFDCLYKFLSDYTHPSFMSLQLVLDDVGRLNPLENELQIEALLFSVCFSAMVLDEMRHLQCLSSEVKKDLQVVTRRIGHKASQLLSHYIDPEEQLPHMVLFRKRVEILGMTAVAEIK
ncbi:DUF5677 domain-containing protein [Xanthomonas sp. SS]|uniref:DUF5677 domain-containing protein n=1 Tax=Xanthomonas sp. SS TaxID=2724122 RepID=UPI00163AB516|nr:DUF5677 domain-containing protein [Xanthomonas sp. SS]